MAPKAQAKKYSYEQAEPLAPGEVLTDNRQNQWKIGKHIGGGGFGDVYSACEVGSKSNHRFVVKIEPKVNGPLFVEMHFYMRNALSADIESFNKKHNFKSLGIPKFVANGLHEVQDVKHRFIVLPRFHLDLDEIFITQKFKIPLDTVYRLGWQIVNTLEYIHSRGYVHGDIKASNIVLGSKEDQVYLIDFGLACRYSKDHLTPNPKKKNNGTIKYMSCDAHDGVSTLRGDIENLAYNLIEWSGGKLPWIVMNQLDKPEEVRKSKQAFMKDVKLLKICYGKVPIPGQLSNFIDYAAAMEADEDPNYAKIRKLFEAGIMERGRENSGMLEF